MGINIEVQLPSWKRLKKFRRFQLAANLFDAGFQLPIRLLEFYSKGWL
jgi:hypothetical protein